MRSFRLAAVLALIASPAGAGPSGMISNELSAGTTSSDQATSLRALSNFLLATLYVNEQWSITFGGMLTVEGTRPPEQGNPFETRASPVALFTLGADYDLSDHWTFGLALDASPKSTRRLPSELVFSVTTPRGAVIDTPVDVLLRTTNSNYAAALNAGWDSAGESAVEFAVTAGATLNHLTSEQVLEQIQRAADGSIITADQARAFCTAAPKSCPRGFKAALQEQAYVLDSLRLAVAGTMTVFANTDLTAGVDGYLYAQDPTNLGYFRVAASGRSSFSGGTGIPIAPLAVLGRFEAVQRLGKFSARLFGTAGRYVKDTGGNTFGLGLKLQYKLTDTFRMWLTGTGQWDEDAQDQAVTSMLVLLGAAVRF